MPTVEQYGVDNLLNEKSPKINSLGIEKCAPPEQYVPPFWEAL
jgi:hypothetical protein